MADLGEVLKDVRLGTPKMRRMTCVLTLALTFAAAGCSSGGGLSGDAPSPGFTASARGTDPAMESLVKRVALANADIPTVGAVTSFAQGDEVAGQITLDYCGYDFASEQQRVARHQVAILAFHDKADWASNEVVAYDTALSATKALNEVRDAVAECPEGVYEPSHVRGIPDLQYRVLSRGTDESLPVVDNTSTVFMVSAEGVSQPKYNVSIFQRRGRVLDAIYLNSSKPFTLAQLAQAKDLARVTGKKLAAT
jgi:hypothetical protein